MPQIICENGSNESVRTAKGCDNHCAWEEPGPQGEAYRGKTEQSVHALDHESPLAVIASF